MHQAHDLTKLLISIDCRLTRCSSGQGHVDASYPPQGLKSAVELFLSGSPTVDAFEAKLAYLQYTLLDLNVPSVCVGLRCDMMLLVWLL